MRAFGPARGEQLLRRVGTAMAPTVTPRNQQRQISVCPRDDQDPSPPLRVIYGVPEHADQPYQVGAPEADLDAFRGSQGAALKLLFAHAGHPRTASLDRAESRPASTHTFTGFAHGANTRHQVVCVRNVRKDEAMNDSALQAAPVEEVLAGLRIPPLPAGTSPAGLLAFVKLHEPDGGTGWSVRVTAELDDEEVLGLLTGYVEHLRQVAAASWDDGDSTRADD